MNTEHLYNEGDAVRFNGEVWKIRNFMGNRIYTVYRANSMRPWQWEFAYENELEPEDFVPLLRQSIAQAKAKKGDA